MMATAHEIHDVDIAHWVPGTRFFGTDDGQFFVVDADLGDYTQTSANVVRRPTVILFTDAAARSTDLVADHTFDPGTTHEDAVTAAGFTLEGA